MLSFDKATKLINNDEFKDMQGAYYPKENIVAIVLQGHETKNDKIEKIHKYINADLNAAEKLILDSNLDNGQKNHYQIETNNYRNIINRVIDFSKTFGHNLTKDEENTLDGFISTMTHKTKSIIHL